jgi:hypothetical protein
MGIGRVVKKIFGKDDDALEFPQNMILGHTAGEANSPSNPIEETQMMAQRIGYLTIDGPVLNVIALNPQLQDWLMYVTPLNSTAKLDKQQAKLQAARIEVAAARSKLLMKPSTYEANGYQIIEGLRNFAHMRTFEAIDGWKGHLCTENVKRIEAGVVKK